MGIKIEDLLAGLDSDIESKVETTRTKLKAVIQNALRSESRLFKRHRDANGQRTQGEYVDVQVLVKSGVPEHLRGWTPPNLDSLFTLIAAHRPMIAQTKQGLARVSELLQMVASLPGATELISGREKHIPPVLRLLDDLLRSVSGIRLTRAILGAGGDALGRYIYRDPRPNRPRKERVPRIERYWQMIGFVANQLDVTLADLTIVVLSHEQAHAYTHLGHDADGCTWDLDSFKKSDLGLVEGLAQYYYPGSKEGQIPTRSASEGSGVFPSLARRVNMQQHAELPCRGNIQQGSSGLSIRSTPEPIRLTSASSKTRWPVPDPSRLAQVIDTGSRTIGDAQRAV